ncbi:type III-B CRISPR module-associated protein Cmr5 [Gynuella sp.]|uniref:type III-B CRISPR module-associated protein Cmr5 n=1 Tax=Gynuella sp. TaxID=2969146 RepID=UPI003D141BBA
MLLSRNQRIAAEAYKQVVKRTQSKDPKKYGALVHKLPAMIMQNGLTQTTGFLMAKNETEHQEALEDLSAVLKSIKAIPEEKKLHTQLLEMDLLKTMEITRHALTVSAWMRRYVQGILKIDATGESIDGAEKEESVA